MPAGDAAHPNALPPGVGAKVARWALLGLALGACAWAVISEGTVLVTPLSPTPSDPSPSAGPQLRMSMIVQDASEAAHVLPSPTASPSAAPATPTPSPTRRPPRHLSPPDALWAHELHFGDDAERDDSKAAFDALPSTSDVQQRLQPYVPSLGNMPVSHWSRLCQALVPVEAGVIRSTAQSLRVPDALDWEEEALEEVMLAVDSSMAREVHTDVCVGLAATLRIGEFGVWNPSRDPACMHRCPVRTVTASSASEAWKYMEEYLAAASPTGTADIPLSANSTRPRVAVSGLADRDTKAALRGWMRKMVGTEEDDFAFSDDASDVLDAWLEAEEGDAEDDEMDGAVGAERVVWVYGGGEGATSVGSQRTKMARMRRFLSVVQRRQCADVLLVRAEALWRDAQRLADSYAPGGLRASTSAAERGALEVVGAFVGVNEVPWDVVESMVSAAEESTGYMPSVMQLLPAAAMVRSWCRPQPGGGPLCRSRHGAPTQTSTRAWNDPPKPLPLATHGERHLNFTQRPPARFIHVHKASGTSMCAMAMTSERATPGIVCAGALRSSCGGRQIVESCDLVSELAYAKTTMIASEAPPEAPLCDGEAIYWTVLRDPIDLTESNIVYSFAGKSTAAKIEQALSSMPAVSALKFIPRTDSVPTKFPSKFDSSCYSATMVGGLFTSALAYDSLQTRYFLGLEGAFLPLGALRRVHVERAKAVLRQLCAIGIVDLLGTSFHGVASSIGWRPEEVQLVRKNVGKDYSCFALLPGANMRDAVRRRLQWDIMLMNYVRGVVPHAGRGEGRCDIVVDYPPTPAASPSRRPVPTPYRPPTPTARPSMSRRPTVPPSAPTPSRLPAAAPASRAPPPPPQTLPSKAPPSALPPPRRVAFTPSARPSAYIVRISSRPRPSRLPIPVPRP